MKDEHRAFSETAVRDELGRVLESPEFAQAESPETPASVVVISSARMRFTPTNEASVT